MALEENSVTGAFVRAGDRIGHVHFSDTNRGVPGTGNLDFLGIVKTLRAVGYDGWIAVEINDRPDIRTAAGAAAGYVRALLEIAEFGASQRT
jgi:sugar phosphate isomerase/epimerase